MAAQQLSSKYAYVNAERAAEFHFSNSEWSKITDSLTRNPNALEALILGRAWSDELTGKSGALFLRGVYREDPNAFRKLGESLAGIHIGFGERLVVSGKQHNQLARVSATLAVQTTLTELTQELALVGAPPLGFLLVLHVGDTDSSRSNSLFEEVMKESASFSTKLGIPILSHTVYSHSRYEGQPVINAVAFGVGAEPVLDEGNKGKSEQTEENNAATNGVQSKPTVNSVDGVVLYVGMRPPTPIARLGSVPRTAPIDPVVGREFANLLSTLTKDELVIEGSTIHQGGMAIAAGHLASKAGCGIRLNLDPLQAAESRNFVEQVLFTEFPSRALLLVPQDEHRKVTDIASKHGFFVAQLGEATPGNFVEILFQHQLLASLPYVLFVQAEEQKAVNLIPNPPMLHKSSPAFKTELERRSAREGDPESTRALIAKSKKRGIPIEDRWLDLLADPNIASLSRIHSMSDMWGSGKALDAGLVDVALARIRITDPSVSRPTRAIAVSAVSQALYSSIDPYLGGAHSAADAMRRIATTGAYPAAGIQLLNFGDPSKYRQISEFAEAIRGISDACKLWNVPILSDIVSFQSTASLPPAFPTPVFIMCGVVKDILHRGSGGFQNRGDIILQLGNNRPELSVSEFNQFFFRGVESPVHNIDFPLERQHAEFVADLISAGILKSARSISLGGFATALTDCCFRTGKQFGATASFTDPSIPLEEQLFGESGGRFLVSCSPDDEAEVRARAKTAKVEIAASGVVGTKELKISGASTSVLVPVGSSFNIWNTAVDVMLGD